MILLLENPSLKMTKKKIKFFFERSILNLMIINNYNGKQKNKVFKKEIK